MVCILFNMNPIICLAITVSDKYGRKGALPHLKLVGERCPPAFATFAIDDIQCCNICSTYPKEDNRYISGNNYECTGS